MDEKLTNICKYYLNCLSLENDQGVSADLESGLYVNYVELFSLSNSLMDDKADELIGRAISDSRIVTYVGYPNLIVRDRFRNCLKVVPVFLLPVETAGTDISISKIPHVNMEIIRVYSSKERENQVYDLIELENELGLNSDKCTINLDELVEKLQEIRNWNWKEKIDVLNLNIEKPIQEMENEGIYNKAILIVTEKQQFTLGLETELSKLAYLSEDDYKETALYQWIHGDELQVEGIKENDDMLLEVLPMNMEQEMAIRHALKEKNTIVTGPPGTGKSQVVTNLLINSVWKKESVLFTSKNNKAVNVVESRVNSVGRYPITLRMGGGNASSHLLNTITRLLNNTVNQNDYQDYRYFKNLYKEKIDEYEKLKEEKHKVVELRNSVDNLEQNVCLLRESWEDQFPNISNNVIASLEKAYKAYLLSSEKYKTTKGSFWGRLLWLLIGKNLTTKKDESLSELTNVLRDIGRTLNLNEHLNEKEEQFAQINKEVENILYELNTILEYKEALKQLLEIKRLEEIDQQLMAVKAEMAMIAGNLWNKWLSIRTKEIDVSLRQEMHEFATMLQMPRAHGERYHYLTKKAINFLPCWAVTALSARGRIPFEAGIFDTVVIDEASQCDIASALPMLYRAKKAVVIGDPKQLSHISTLSKIQDLRALEKYNVNMCWSYSVNSLYARASSLVQSDQIIQLKDHHRSASDIIEFSNAEFYEKKLRVATNHNQLKSPISINKALCWIDVKGQTIRPASGSVYNGIEADIIVKELRRLILEENYDGTVGVVTPFRKQAEMVREKICADRKLFSSLQSKNDFLVDTVHKFQGDERDVIFFSPVISKGTTRGAVEFLNNTSNLFNVAITRARATLVVVGDRTFCSNSGISYMERFVNYISKLDSKHEQEKSYEEKYPSDRLYPTVANPEQVSDWERYFYTALFDQGIRVIPQYSVERYKLDFAIIKGNKKLDIEIDGELYHKTWNGELCYRDQLRNQRLFELGWDVHRFWVYQIRDDLQGCINIIKQWCNEA